MAAHPTRLALLNAVRSAARRFAAGGVVLCATVVVLVSCMGERATAPTDATDVRYARGISFNAIFPQGASTAASVIQFDRVHVQLHRTDGRLALDTTIAFPSDSAQVSLDLSVRLESGTPASGELMTLDLGYLDATGAEVFHGGPVQIRATPFLAGQAPPPPVAVPVVYSGPGANARSVRIAPRTLTVNSGDPFTLVATALDAAGVIVPTAPVIWTSLDPTRASLNQANAGAGKALAQRGPARIVAQLVSGQADTVIVNVQPVPAAIGGTSGDGQTGVVGKPYATALSQPLSVKLTAADGLPVAGVTVNFSVSSGGGSVSPATAVTDANGVAQTTWTLGNTVGAQTAVATVPSLNNSAVTFNATAKASVATKLAFTTAPAAGASVNAGTPISFAVTAQDVDGDAVTTFTGPITLSLPTAVAGVQLSGTLTANAVAGVATFTNVSIGTPGAAYALQATANGLASATSPSFAVVTGGAARLIVAAGTGQSAAPSSALSPITVVLTDVAGNAKPNALVKFAITAGGGSVVPDSAFTDGSGRASTVWTLGSAVGVQSITASAGGVSPVTISATALGSGNHWVITQAPSATQAAGVAITPALVAELRDNSNNVVTSFTGATTVAIGANPGGSTLSGASSVSAVAGVATFGALSLDKAGTGYTLVVSSSGTTSATTSTFTVNAGAATTLALVSGNNQTGTLGSALAQPIVVKVSDAFGNPVSGATVTYTITSGGGSVGAASVTTNASGIASTAWTLGAAGAQTLAVASTGLTGSPITVSAITGSGSVISTVVAPQVDTITSITDVQQLTATARDASNAIVAGNFTWTSRNPSIATVDPTGLVTAVANGTTRIVVTEAGGTKDSATVVVQQRIATINVTPSSRSIYLTGTFPFTAAAVDGRGVPMTSQPAITWSSTAPSVASVNASTGLVTGVAIGSAQIRATSGTFVGIANLSVLSPISRIDVTFDSTGAPAPDVFTMTALGDTRAYRAIARDTLLNVMPGVTFTWSSSNASVAVVNGTSGTQATATAVANGLASVQATAQGVTGAATLTVAQQLTSIDLSPTAVTVAPTGVTSLVARGRDRTGHFIPGGTFSFASSNPSIATVNATSGLVTGVATGGTANITATSGSITSNVSVVTVGTSGPAQITFGRDTIGVGRGTSLSVPILLSKPSGSAVTVNLAVADTFAFWSAASVVIPAGQTSANVTINGHNAGTTTITALDAGTTGFAGDTAVLAVQANARLTSGGYSMNATDQVSTQVVLSDPSPAGGTFITFQYSNAAAAQVSPDPAFIPAGQLAANIVIRGLAAGSTTITPTATGVNGAASSVNVTAANLNLNTHFVRLGQGQNDLNDYAYLPNNLNSALQLTLRSTDTSIVTVVPTLTIPAGTNYAYFDVVAKGRGTASVVVSANGWKPDTMIVQATSPALQVCCGTTTTSTQPAFQITVYATDSVHNAHYRNSSLLYRVTSSDSTVMRVVDTVGTIAAGQYYSSSARIQPAGGGTAWIKVTASGHAPDSTQYVVVGPALSFSYTTSRLGAGEEDQNFYVQVPNNVTAPLTITLANSDSSKAAAPATITIPTGQNYQYYTLRGKAAGVSTFIAQAAGYKPDTAVTTVTTPKATLFGPGTMSAFQSSTLTAYATDSTGVQHLRSTPVTFHFASSDTTVLTVDSVGTIAAGAYYAQPNIKAVGSGASAKIFVTAPGHLPDSVTVTVQPAKLNLSFTNYTIGARQQRNPTDFYVYTPNSRSVAVPVTITQRYPSRLQLSATSVTIPANQNYQYFTFAGLTRGADTIIVSAAGYLPDTAFVTVAPTKLVYGGGLPSSATTTNPPSTMTVYAADSTGTQHYTSDTVAVRLVSTNTAVLVPDSAYVHIIKGNYYAQPTAHYVGVGSARIMFTDSAGVYAPDSTNVVTVTGPTLQIGGGNTMLGMRQNSGTSGFYVATPNNVSTPLTVNLVSTDPRVVGVPGSVTIPANSNFAYFTVSGLDTIGTIQIQATATGYSPAATNVQVTAPKFIVSATTSLYTTSPASVITVYAADQNGTTHAVSSPVTVTLGTSAPGVATVDSTTITIPAGQYYSQAAKWSPVNVGTATLTASDARSAYYAYVAGSQVVNVSTPAANVSFGTSLTLGVGQYLDQAYVYLPNNPQSALTVPIAHAPLPAHTNTPSSVTIPTTQNYQYFRVTATSVGKDTLTFSPPGHTAAKSVVDVQLGRVDPLAGLPSTIRAGDSTLVTLYARDQATNVRTVAAATTFTLAPNANIVFTSGGSQSAVITQVTIPADAQYIQFYVKGVAAGTASVTITSTNYTSYTTSFTVTP